VKRHSVLLRKGCVLPGRLDPVREPFGDNWMLVEEIMASVFDTMIRQAGWHCVWMRGSCTRRGFGLTEEDATRRAMTRALKAIPKRFNAAEFDSVKVANYPGFYVANVTLRPREIQQYTSLDTVDKGHPQPVHAR
jgi:hypothetical protein